LITSPLSLAVTLSVETLPGCKTDASETEKPSVFPAGVIVSAGESAIDCESACG